jgi:TetR/AcrR family transcriptional repressor of nem operon
MARKSAFNYERAIQQATLLFWKKGYSNASLRDLLHAMGIGESSFYNIVKSKKALYLECLKHYNETVSRRRLSALHSHPSVQKAVRAFFTTVLDDLDQRNTPRVCLMAGSLSNDVLSERDLNRYVLDEMATFEGAFIERLTAAKKTGELPKNFKVDAASQIIVTYLQGLFRMIGVLHNRTEVEEQVETLLTGLKL